MKYLLIIIILLLTLVSWSEENKLQNISLYNTLENYKWKKRILLLITKEKDITLVDEVNEFFITQKCKNDERNLELLKIIKDNYDIKIPEYFQNKTGIWLIGYDGYIKAYTEDNSLLSNVHNLIDNMPIRKEEIKELKKNVKFIIIGMTYKIKDNDNTEYEIIDIKKFSKHIFQFHSIGISLHQEEGYNFTVDDAFREKIAKFLKK